MKITIKTIAGKILLKDEAESVKNCIENAVVQRANLRGANLRKADLREANLCEANLREADLRKANLREADLRKADLRKADLRKADLREADLRKANLREANLYRANLCEANLCGANLYEANLYEADLYGANLYEANLREANLRGADLHGADLCGVKNINKYLTTPMYILLDQTNPVRAYKIVNEINQGIHRGGLVYEINKIISEKDYDVDEYLACGKGINLASLDWCLKEWKPGYKIIVCEFNKEDIVCIPVGSDGKFRVKTCKPIRELNLADYGIDNTNA